MNISVIVPACNEAGNVLAMHQSLIQALSGNAVIETFEIIFVDDGSTDRTAAELEKIRGPGVQVLRHERRMGKTRALKDGFDAARFDVLVVMDADLQYDPAEIPLMIQALDQSNDFVIGYRGRRQDSIVRLISSRIANGFRRLVLRDRFRDVACGFFAFKRRCLGALEFYEGAHRFFSNFADMKGFRVAEVPVSHRPRLHGSSNYGILNRVFRGGFQLMMIRLRRSIDGKKSHC